MIVLKVIMKWLAAIWLVLVLALKGNAEGFELTVRLASVPGGQVLLAHYYGASILVDDTIRLDNRGEGLLRRDTLLPQGIYKIYLNQDTHFDFLLGKDQTLTISNPDFKVPNMTIEGAAESLEFLAYMKWIGQHQQTRKKLEDQRSGAGEAEIKKIEAQLRALTEEVKEYWKRKSVEYPGSFLGAFLMSNYQEELNPEDIPENIRSNDSLNWVYQYNFRKNNYFNYFDLRDERFLYTPSIKPRLDTYFEKVLIQMYDSVKPAAYEILSRVEPFPRMYRYVVSYLLNHSMNSRIMGMDALFVDIARDYYLSGKAPWADSTTIARIRENVLFFENGLIGNQARDFQMETWTGEPFRLYQQNARYMILVFYEPNCSHCREYLPALYNDIYLKFRDDGVDVTAVYAMDNKQEWGEFIEKHHLTDWHNVWDEHHLTRFKVHYDTRTTPAVYLLDKDKKILAKKFTLEFLQEYLPFLLRGN